MLSQGASCVFRLQLALSWQPASCRPRPSSSSGAPRRTPCPRLGEGPACWPTAARGAPSRGSYATQRHPHPPPPPLHTHTHIGMPAHLALHALTQVFLVDLRSTKKMIKDAVAQIYEIQCEKVNTLIR